VVGYAELKNRDGSGGFLIPIQNDADRLGAVRLLVAMDKHDGYGEWASCGYTQLDIDEYRRSNDAGSSI